MELDLKKKGEPSPQNENQVDKKFQNDQNIQRSSLTNFL